jgi:hypothetical protein
MPDDPEIDPREAARIRRRARDAEGEGRALLRPGMSKVFKQIQDAQRNVACKPPRRGGSVSEPKQGRA